MIETPKEAARRLASSILNMGYKPVALHAYTNETGDPLYWRIRAKHPETGAKWIRPMCFNGMGFDLGEPKHPNGKPLYALHHITCNPEADVWIVEGEQKADALNNLGLIATTTGGATSADSANWETLRDRKVIIWPDNDEPGKAYAGEVASILLKMGCSVSCVDLDSLGLGKGEDAMQWLEAHPGATRAEIEALPLSTAAEDDSALEVRYRRLSDIQAKPINWLWPGRIARGKVSMLAGNPGLGKSQVTASLAAIISTGGTWPVDRSRCECGNVVILSAEDDAEDTIRPRLEAARADLSRIYILDAIVDAYQADGEESSRAFNLKTDLSRLGAMLEKIGNIALIVVDPITAYLGDADSHKNAEIRALLAPLANLAAKYGAAVVCVSHLNKGGNNEALMRVTGSLAFVAAARAAYIVTKDRDDDGRRLFLPLKNNLGNDLTGLAFAVHSAQIRGTAGVIETSRVVWESEPVTVTADEAMTSQAEERSQTDEAKEWLENLLAYGGMKATDAQREARQAGISDKALRRAREKLGIKPTKEAFSGGWRWALPHHEDAQDAQDVHIRKLGNFDTNGHLRQSISNEIDIAEVII